jgi:hypothetical protein
MVLGKSISIAAILNESRFGCEPGLSSVAIEQINCFHVRTSGSIAIANLLQVQMIVQNAAIEIESADTLRATLEWPALAGGSFLVLAALEPGFGLLERGKRFDYEPAFIIGLAE